MQVTQERQAVTHIIEVENPTTGVSRMFTGTDLDAVVDEARFWLDGEFGGEIDDDEFIWEG